MPREEKRLDLGPRVTDRKVEIIKCLQRMRARLEELERTGLGQELRLTISQIREKILAAEAFGMKDPQHPLIPFGCGHFGSPYRYISSLESYISKVEENLE